MDIPTCFLFPVLKPSEFEAFTLIQSQSRTGMALHALGENFFRVKNLQSICGALRHQR